MKDSVYFAVAGAGNVLWNRLVDGATRAQLVEALTLAFDDLDAVTATSDVDEFIAACLEHKLIETLD